MRNNEQIVLGTLRRIIRATDIHSRHLNKTAGLTTPQLLLLAAVKELGAVSISMLSAELSLSQATVTTIINRLEGRGFLQRHRSERDKRVVHAVLTREGETLLASSPEPLQEIFSKRFRALEDWEQHMIIAALQRVSTMMDAEEIDASPVLHIGQEIEGTSGLLKTRSQDV